MNGENLNSNKQNESNWTTLDPFLVSQKTDYICKHFGKSETAQSNQIFIFSQILTVPVYQNCTYTDYAPLAIAFEVVYAIVFLYHKICNWVLKVENSFILQIYTTLVHCYVIYVIIGLCFY